MELHDVSEVVIAMVAHDEVVIAMIEAALSS
jgi:hypothetical protein